MNCRPLCGACCIAPSISSSMPKMPQGKPAGVKCLHLTNQLQCELFGLPSRPIVCSSLSAEFDMCGETSSDALHYLQRLEVLTLP